MTTKILKSATVVLLAITAIGFFGWCQIHWAITNTINPYAKTMLPFGLLAMVVVVGIFAFSFLKEIWK